MDQQQSFNLNADFLGGYSAVFMKLVFVLIAVYLLVMVVNFLRDKFIHAEPSLKKEDMADLLLILNKLFYVAGFGFVIANIFQFLLSQIESNHRRMGAMSFQGDWDYLTFGIIILFVGLGFKAAYKALQKKRLE
ncbi:hypothetical protein [Sunxiuqinia dokdonensis]|uniref:DUF2975 domain-containing protein n=1 Tax=Sunxiuqinia dokdonensis TaxID=1409788 RepID=A0A0L8V8F8_9BACT|nr:hypothetical protein [Sunxiuqinia dokdonensis]KOH44731.1 hypothetical protein NC99_24700 [Sunxiuqinia dokdonensis]